MNKKNKSKTNDPNFHETGNTIDSFYDGANPPEPSSPDEDILDSVDGVLRQSPPPPLKKKKKK